MSKYRKYWGLGELLEVDDSIDLDALSYDEVEVMIILEDPRIKVIRE